MSRMNLCVLFGGASSEHEISLKSAASVLRGLDTEKYNIITVGITKQGDWFYLPSVTPDEVIGNLWQSCDKEPCTVSVSRSERGIVCMASGKVLPVEVVFPVLHGENGEDGRIQGLFELAGIPCVGPGCLSSAVCMDKSVTKLIAATTGVRQADWVLVTDKNCSEKKIGEIENKFSYPVFIKPAGTGSSVGTAKANDRKELVAGVEAALPFGGKVLVEEYINAREIETAALGNGEPEISVCGEVVASREFYSYESKYLDGTSEIVIPAKLLPETSEKIRAYAKDIYMALGCRGLSRVDFFVDKTNGEIVFNEINTIPGFTDISMYAKLFAACGVEFKELLDRIIACALEA